MNKHGFLLTLLLAAATVSAQVSYPVTIRTTVIPPVSPFFDQMLSSITGGRLMVMVTGNSPSGRPLQVKLAGSLQRLSPSPFTINLNPNFQPAQPINLPPSVPVTLSNNLLEQTFGNFNTNNLIFQSISVNDLRDGLNYKLPEGTYRICFTAYNFTDAGNLRPLSDPNSGCSIFTICYKASAPQFIQPVNGINLNSSMPVVNPAYPLQFTWTVPQFTCASALPRISYDLEMHEIFPGQTPTDAINNAPVFMRQGLPTAIFPFDTLLYKDVLQQGKQYAIRVHANTGGPAGAVVNAVSFDNNGFSTVQAFQYGTAGLAANMPPGNSLPPVSSNPPTSSNPPVNNPPTNNPVDSSKNNQTDTSKNTAQKPNAYDSVADCGVKPPTDSIPIDANTSLQGSSLTIGSFTLTATSITRNNDSTYKGSGTIAWKPKGITLKLAVEFSNIKVNKSKQVFAGLVTSSTAQQKFQGFGSWSNFSKQSGGQLDQLSNDVDNFLSSNKATQLVSQITGNTPVNFPIGLDNQNMGGTPVTLAIMSMAFSPKGATMSVLFDMNIPEANGWLSLAGTNFCLSPTGVSFTQGTLFLPTDRYFTFGSDGDSLIFKGCPTADSTKGTYVSWAGDSLSAVVAHARLTFPKTAVVREDTAGNVLDSAVAASIEFRFHKWDDWVASIGFPRFQIVGVKGLSFIPGTIFYDHSTRSNPTGFNLPKDYTGYSGNDFEGLYIKDMKVLLPADFKTFNQGKTRTGFEAKDFVIDDKGVSVDVLGTKIIDLTDGNLGGWAFSLDTVEVEIKQNTFAKGAFNGQILMPISKTPLAYEGDLHKGGDSTSKDSSLQYEFVVKPSDSMKIDLWQAYVQLNQNSAFQVKKDSLGAAISFVLNGTIGINISNGTPNLNFPAIKFDSLGLANRDPKTHANKFWFSPGTWAFASPQKTVSGFPVSINNVAPAVDMNDPSNLKLGVKFDLNINLGFGDESVISATTNLFVYGKINASFANMAPQISLSGGVDVDSVMIKGDVGPVGVDGYLVFYNHDNTYGDGLKGHVSATFPMVAVEATAQFGYVNNFNYWYIDACANFPTIPIAPTPIGINGFGGGAYYNMAMSTNLPADPSNLQAASQASDVTPGKTLSGVTFTPQAGTAGIRATVCMAMATGSGADAMNAKVTLTAQISNGALSLLDLQGNVYVMTNYPQNDQATVQGAVDIQYDFTQNKFSLDADIQGKFGPVTAEIPIGMYGGPDGWYFKIGDAFGKRVSFTLLDVKSDIFAAHIGATAYFEMGSLVNPALPPLPNALISFGVQRNPSVDNLVTSMNKADGNGFMFGAEVDGSLKFSVAMLYANVNAILGFDLALKHFANNFMCGGTSAGWQNWYALGQIYFYFDLDVGIHVDVWFAKGDFDLVKFQAGALLSAGLPNPTWLDGSVHVKGDLFGGLISMDADAHFTIGDKCYPTPDPLSDVQIISDYGPKNTGDVFDYPYVASNVGLDMNYDVQVPPTSQKPDGETRTYRFDISSYTVSAGKGNLPGVHMQYQNNNTTGILMHDNILAAHTTYTVTVVCSVTQYYPDENRWDNPFNDQDQAREPVQQTTTWNFTTGDAPTYIPDKNVHFAYPVNDQRYVLKQELNGSGMLQLGEWQENILPGNQQGPLASRKYQLFFIEHGTSDTIKTSFTVNTGARTINYNLPAGLKNSTVYRMEFWSTPGAGMAPTKVLSSVSSSTRTIKGVSVNLRQTAISGPIRSTNTAPQPIYTMYFGTSRYNTFADKINALGAWNGSRSGNNILIQNPSLAPELFDQYEVKGFHAPDGTAYPSLFNARIEWDHNQANDQFADDNLYANAFTLAFKQVATNFGAPELREQIYKPVATLDWSGFSYDGPLTLSETLPPVNPMLKVSNATVHLPAPGGSSGQGNSSTPITTGGGYSISVPAAIGARSGAGMSQVVVKMAMPYQLKWTRDYYIQQDYDLLSAFGLVAQTQAAITQHQLDPSQAEEILGQMDGNINFVWNAIGGSVSMPWDRFYSLYTDPNSMAILNKMRNLKFTAYPAGTRSIRFRYQAGTLEGNAVTKTFTTK
ncbi:MAG: hypothetical protein Q8938_12435 [Bacteroidota bacterium]|nr:hypothetical protein [Bacteroidota bacterium]